MLTKIFIDGSAGTTGLQIYDRLKQRDDIQILEISEENRKDNDARKDFFNEADIAFLCLPDAAAIEAVTLALNKKTVIIDTSTAHRVSEGWAYGMPELKGQREIIKNSKRIANPGCHASGFIALVAPLIENKILSPEEKLSCFSITGYSGGGKKMIAEYETQGRDILLDAPRQYALTQNHKHLPEIQKICELNHAPIFCPIVADFYSGMEVTVPIHDVNIKKICEVYENYYHGGVIHFNNDDNEKFLSASAFSGRDDMEIKVAGNDERVLLIARFDNLGKGASGAAVQNMNLVMGVDEFKGLNL
ncbi:MAG: N-acetyl-gamma-glutamyl-phosphate reductase [Synergistaceae bacterium]|nr:N-acetyl-gamma-glutamyl-phosphate reductase [Synergistaceae bacterium]